MFISSLTIQSKINYKQPVVNYTSGKFNGIRIKWLRPMMIYGLVSPLLFIVVADDVLLLARYLRKFVYHMFAGSSR